MVFRVEKLEKDISKEIYKPSYQLEGDLLPGNHYVAFFENKYSRVRLIDMENNVANCFFVDYGDYQSIELKNLWNLPERFITRLPFQVKISF